MEKGVQEAAYDSDTHVARSLYRQELFAEVARIVHQTRDERLCDDFGLDPAVVDNDSWPHEDPLSGHCHENAELLARRLSEAGYEPDIIWGAIAEPPFDPPETVKEAESDGVVHFWVELRIEGLVEKPIVADLSKETGGWPLVSGSLPENYIRLARSRIPYAPEISSRNLRNHDRYADLAERGYVR